MKNPFKYGMRVRGCDFFDRKSIMRDICNTLDGDNNVLVYGPRRYGKSSMVGEILEAIHAKGGVCIELNMMDIASLDDFIARYASAIYRELAPVSGTLKLVAELFRRVKPTVSIDEEGKPELSFAITSPKAGLDALREALELPEKLCSEGKHVYVALDEFQEVTELGLGAQFERTMRSVVEKQQRVSYIYLGSKTHLLERMFNSQSRPFYNSAQKFLLLRPPETESAEFLVNRFHSVGIVLSPELAKEMVRLVDNVPYYLQAIGSWTFNSVTGRSASVISANDIREGFESLYSSERVHLEDVFISHPQSQRLLMRAIAREPISTFTEDYRLRHNLASTSTINTALRRLVSESTIDRQDGVYRHADPILAYHLSNHA